MIVCQCRPKDCLESVGGGNKCLREEGRKWGGNGDETCWANVIVLKSINMELGVAPQSDKHFG